MAVFAVITDGLVSNLVESEELGFVAAIFADEADEIVSVSESTGPAFIGGGYVNEKFVPLQPFASWAFDEATWAWKPPTPSPEKVEGVFHVWSEDTLDWVEFIPPVIETPAE